MAAQDSRLSIQEDGDMITARFLDKNILDETRIQQIGDEIIQVVERSSNLKLLLVFDNVEHLSSAALGMLITVNNKVRQRGGQLRLSEIDPQLLEVFTITKLNQLFQIYDRTQEAVDSFK